MDFKIGDIVICEDPYILENWKEFRGIPAIIYMDQNCKIFDNNGNLRLRFSNYEYRVNCYHVVDPRFCKKAPLLLQELF